MFLSIFLFGVLLPGPTSPDLPIVRQVDVVGNIRVPAAAILRRVSAVPRRPFDAEAFQADVRRLYGMGVFQNVEISSRDAGGREVDVTYRVREFPFVSAFLVEGVKEGLSEQIHDLLQKEKLEIHPATPFNPSQANKAALAVRDFLRARKHPNAEVRVVPERNGDNVRVFLSINPGPRVEVGEVRFTGNASIPEGELRKQMTHIRAAPFWARWAGAGRYVPEELTIDLERIRHYYQSNGFATAVVGTPEVQAEDIQDGFRVPLPLLSDPGPKVVVEIPIVEGPRFSLSSMELQGDAKEAAPEVAGILRTIRIPSIYSLSALEDARQKIVDALGHHGYALARVDLEQATDPDKRTVRAIFRVIPGDPVVIGKIEFDGNKRLPDRFLRRELRTSEGEVYDSARLDASVERLNKSNLVKPISRSDVVLRMDEQRNAVDIIFKVKEKDRQGIYGTGGTAGIGGGYLGLLYTAFNLLRLGEMLSFELDGGASQSNMLLNIVGTHFLGTPFTVALSGFNRLTDFNVANIVPGPEDLVQVLRRRTAGVGLTGAYPITSKLQAGMGFQVARDTITGEAQRGSALLDGPADRSDLTPFLLFDSTTGTGASTRGFRASYVHTFSGSSFLRSLDSTADSFQYARHVNDPWTHGRNSFAFMFQASTVRPRGDSPLFLERRLFPGDESVRGFQRGNLSPWAIVPGNSACPLQPAGADTLLGFSSEYRVPIRGGLSGVAFMDLGWTHLSPLEASQLGDGARLLQETNGLLRMSLGGELRLQLPMIRQPARLIFAWNPLRLNDALLGSSSLFHLSDPRCAVHFALGSLF